MSKKRSGKQSSKDELTAKCGMCGEDNGVVDEHHILTKAKTGEKVFFKGGLRCWRCNGNLFLENVEFGITRSGIGGGTGRKVPTLKAPGSQGRE